MYKHDDDTHTYKVDEKLLRSVGSENSSDTFFTESEVEQELDFTHD